LKITIDGEVFGQITIGEDDIGWLPSELNTMSENVRSMSLSGATDARVEGSNLVIANVPPALMSHLAGAMPDGEYKRITFRWGDARPLTITIGAVRFYTGMMVHHDRQVRGLRLTHYPWVSAKLYVPEATE
jgi:hypothetical protein